MKTLFETLLRSNFRFGRMLSSRAQLVCGCFCRTRFAASCQ